MQPNKLEERCRKFLDGQNEHDAAHDIAHIKRVVKNSTLILSNEQADPQIVIAAAWLHDCIVLSKDHPDRKKASTLAAEKAAEFLSSVGYPANKIPAVAHAVEAHSYSGGIPPKTIEAKIVQDADRLDALGAIGIARCFSVGGELKRPIYHPDDPFVESREPDDSVWTVDHFYEKLFRLPELLNTDTAQKMAAERVQYMKSFLEQLSIEVC
jgi:uncharacterized protein